MLKRAVLVLVTTLLAFAQQNASGLVQMGTVTGRVIGPGPNGSGLESAKVRLFVSEVTYAAAVTDSAGFFSLTAPCHPFKHYGLYAGHAGYDEEWHRVVEIFPDSVNRQPDIYLWPECYLDTAAYHEFTASNSVTLGSRRDDCLRYDSTLLRVYRNYLHGTHPLVLRVGIHKPHTPSMRDRPREFTEDGAYLLTGVKRCRYMTIEGFGPWESGMRLWDVDSIQLGSYSKSGFGLCREQTPSRWDWVFGLCLRVFLAKRGPVLIERRF